MIARLTSQSERALFSSFKTYFQLAGLLCEDKQIQLQMADKVFKNKNGFSYIKPFLEAYQDLYGKKIIEFDAGVKLAKRHKVSGKSTSKGLNKGIAPDGYMNKGELICYLRDNYQCPASMIQLILDEFSSLIKQTTYPNELETCGEICVVNVPCYFLNDILMILDYICQDAWQKNTLKKKVSSMCHIPKLQKNFKFNVEAFRELRKKDL